MVDSLRGGLLITTETNNVNNGLCSAISRTLFVSNYRENSGRISAVLGQMGKPENTRCHEHSLSRYACITPSSIGIRPRIRL